MIYILKMSKTDPQTFLPLKNQWFHIMLALAAEDQHGYGIMQEAFERSGGKVRLWPAAVYGSIKQLMEAGLIAESAERPAPELDDARRRYYCLTDLGRQVLDAERERLEELVRLMNMRRGALAQ